ncbi:MAG: sigma 54-interacting transcriptional regulator [Desulfatiglandales bacterium]
MKSLRSKLILAVSGLVVGSGLLISILASQRYSASLLETMSIQGESIAQAMALEAAEKILINDLVALQKTLDNHMHSHSELAYLFIQRGDDILAHTFPGGIPSQLPAVNRVGEKGESRLQRIVSVQGGHYLDVAWPVFEGKAGVLRLGLWEKPYQNKVARLWLQMGILTLTILVVSVSGALFYLRRVTTPLAALASATEKLDQGEWGTRVAVHGEDEVSRLAEAFNRMAARVEDYTTRLEAKAIELERANQQTRNFCRMVQEIGSLRSLDEIGARLLSRLRAMLPCASPMVLLLLPTKRDRLFILKEEGGRFTGDKKHADELLGFLQDQKAPVLSEKFEAILPVEIQSGSPSIIVPIHHEEQPAGALLVMCREVCGCDAKDIDAICMILSQSVGVIGRALRDEEELQEMHHRVEASSDFCGIVGRDAKMQGIYRLVENVAPTDATVLIQGESGTGKEMVARAIHRLSPRKEKPFVVIDCSAYPETLLESELFGHEKGAYTGATRQKIGRFEQADGGTVFLDEIGEISPSAQVKLLRVLQTQRFERLGGEKSLTVNVRILAATNKDLLQEVKVGRFREDLYYRLNVIPIHLPPLRERRNDIPLLARHFLSLFVAEQEKKIGEYNPEAMRILLNYEWSGNVRELENSVEHAVVLAKGNTVEISDLPSALVKSNGSSAPSRESARLSTIAENEKDLLTGTLDKCGWNKKEAAKQLGISRNTLYQKLKRYGISKPLAH